MYSLIGFERDTVPCIPNLNRNVHPYSESFALGDELGIWKRVHGSMGWPASITRLGLMKRCVCVWGGGGGPGGPPSNRNMEWSASILKGLVDAWV